MRESIYKRILLKLSGETLQGPKKYGIDPRVVSTIAEEIKDVKKLGLEIDGVSFGLEMTDFNEIKWPEKAKSALVIAASHPRDKPELDWWDAFNSSPGNRTLVRINRELSEWIEETLGIRPRTYHYDYGSILRINGPKQVVRIFKTLKVLHPRFLPILADKKHGPGSV